MPHRSNPFLPPEPVWYVKLQHIIMLSKNLKQFEYDGKKKRVCVCVFFFFHGHRSQQWAGWDTQFTLWLWEVLQDLIRSRSGLSRVWTIRGRERYHPSATSPAPNGLPHTGLFDCVFDVRIPHAHLLFLCRNISRQHSVRAHKWIF